MVARSKKEEFEEYEKKYLVNLQKTKEEKAESVRISTKEKLRADRLARTTVSSIFERIDFDFKSKLEMIVEIDYINLMMLEKDCSLAGEKIHYYIQEII